MTWTQYHQPITDRKRTRRGRHAEDMIVADPALVGLPIMVIGRQVPTSFGGFVDILGVDAEGRLHVIEVKRDRTPREVVAQVLDYAAWAQDLDDSQVARIYQGDGSFDDAFADRFGVAVPDAFNAEQPLTIVAAELDAASDRIVTFLATRFQVPINAVFFAHFKDGEAEYLARTWLRPPEEVEVRRADKAKVRPWNGRDFYVVLGRLDRHNRWQYCRRFSIVTASGGAAYTKPLRNLRPGNRVFAFLGGAGLRRCWHNHGRGKEACGSKSNRRSFDKPRGPSELGTGKRP